MPIDKKTLNLDVRSPQLIRTYLLYRIVLSLLLWAVYVSGLGGLTLGQTNPDVYLAISSIYLALTILAILVCKKQLYSPKVPLLFSILLTDVVVHTLLMNASGGLGSGIGYLMLVTVAAGSLFFSGQMIILIAAIASICIIMESTFAVLFFTTDKNVIFPAGLLGLFLFFTALITQPLNRALKKAQQVAATKSQQSETLQELNELIISRMLTGIIVIDDQDQIELINEAALNLIHSDNSPHLLQQGAHISAEPALLKLYQNWQKFPWQRTEPFIPVHSNTEVQVNFKQLNQSSTKRTMLFLEDFRAASQQAQQLKLASLGRLTGSIAHEIRNPIGAISHASELLSEADNNSFDNERLTTIISKQVKRVNQIIENVLQLSRKQNHNFEKMDLHHWLNNFIKDYTESAHKIVVIECYLNNSPIYATIDPLHLHQIISNLVDNALRYSHEQTGTLWVGIRTGVGEIDQRPFIDIIDRGAGVPVKDRSNLFEPFFTTSSGGSGLGLYIARELCEINYSTIKYHPPLDYKPGFFRISFAHPGKIL